MDSLTKRIKSLAVELGCDLAGITTLERLSDGPPSADPRGVLSSAHSCIAFALALDREKARDFMSKRSWRPHCEDRKTIVRKLYSIGDRLAELLRQEGFEAVNVDINNNYRAEKGAADVTEMTEFLPEFSHRYAALAAGIGRLGWSGNLMTRKYGALVELGTVVTDARLEPDALIPDNEHPCDKCRICSAVCPVGMVEPRESIAVRVAGLTETISHKRPNTCCWIGCTGYEGLAASGTWSNWSPYRLGRPLPKDTDELNELCISLQKADPQMQSAGNSFDDYRKAVFNPAWFYYTVCGFCRLVCFPRREERVENSRLIRNSGTAALRLDGSHVVADGNAVEVQTPFGLQVIVPQEELGLPPDENTKPSGDLFPLDREVIAFLKSLVRESRS
jgi:epoxyqueuosine reductase